MRPSRATTPSSPSSCWLLRVNSRDEHTTVALEGAAALGHLDSGARLLVNAGGSRTQEALPGLAQ
jgi:hypothetical protein